MRTLHFPPGFRWGSATSSYQVEGHNTNSQWWPFEQEPGAVWHGDRSGAACNWWQNAETDFDLMQAYGLNAHRLSVEWSRIEPRPGVFDAAAIDRYRALLDGLHRRGIEPLISLHHFSNPLWLEEQGAWTRPEVVARFQAFVLYTVGALRDLCNRWLTLNEPNVYVNHAYLEGIFPPRQKNMANGVRVYRHMLLAHGVAYQTIHTLQPEAQVGNAIQLRNFHSLRPGHPGDALAATLYRYLGEDVWMQGVRSGVILPPMGYGDRHPALRDSFDYVGLNYYTQTPLRFTPNPLRLFGLRAHPPGAELSDSGRDGPYSWYSPEGLFDLCMKVRAYGKPILITENGLPDADDDQRPRWILGHLIALHQAIEAGADVRGYYHWTFTDNFEWAEGWGLRFGLIALDPATQQRTPRRSAALLREVAAANAVTPEIVQRYAPELLHTLESAHA